MDLPECELPRADMEELGKLFAIDEDAYGESMACLGKLGGLIPTDAAVARFLGELYPNVKAWMGAPILVNGETVALLALVDVKPRPDWLGRKQQLEDFAAKAGAIIEAGPSHQDSFLDDIPEIPASAKALLSRTGSTCSSDHQRDELLDLARSQLAALSQSGNPAYLAALSRMARQQLSDRMTRKGSLEEEDVNFVRHSLDMEHLKALTDLGSKDANVIHAFENIVAVQRDAVSTLVTRTHSNSKVSSIDSFGANKSSL